MRSIIVEPSFEEARKKVQPNLKRFDEAFAATEWLLARRPDLGTQISETDQVWFIQILDDPGLRPAFIYYTFTDTCVYLLFIELVSETNGDS